MTVSVFANINRVPWRSSTRRCARGSRRRCCTIITNIFSPAPTRKRLVRALIIYGVKFIELFAPLVSPQERDDFQALRAVRDSLITQKGYTFLAGARALPSRATWKRRSTPAPTA